MPARHFFAVRAHGGDVVEAMIAPRLILHSERVPGLPQRAEVIL
jgi:hypothetical protein